MIECKINKKKYIGSSCHLLRRKSSHKSTLKKNKHGNRYLQKDYIKYKKLKLFKWKILKYCKKENLLHFEQFYMDKYKSYDRKFGYNITPKADNSKKSEETKKLLYIFKKGTRHTDASKRKMSISQTGRKHTEETKKKIGRKKYSSFQNEWKKLNFEGYNYCEIGRMYKVQNCVVRRYVLDIFYARKQN